MIAYFHLINLWVATDSLSYVSVMNFSFTISERVGMDLKTKKR